MRSNLSLSLLALLALLLAGCAARGDAKPAKAPVAAPKPAAVSRTPPPPPAPLSIPQTQVQLPPAQPVLPEALAVAEEPAVVELPEPPAQRPVRRVPAAAAPAVPRPETPAPVQAQGPPPAPERPRLVEAISPDDQRRLTDSLAARRREVSQNLDAATARGPNNTEKTMMNRIRSFQKLADDAQSSGDLRQADGLMERAQILSRELHGAR